MSDEVYEGLSRRTGGTLSLAVLGGAGTGKSTFVHSLERAFGSEEGSGQAQAAGLKCILSENVPKEAAVGGDCVFLPLKKELWAAELQKSCPHFYGGEQKVRDAGYDILREAHRLTDFYESALNGESPRKSNKKNTAARAHRRQHKHAYSCPAEIPAGQKIYLNAITALFNCLHIPLYNFENMLYNVFYNRAREVIRTRFKA